MLLLFFTGLVHEIHELTVVGFHSFEFVEYLESVLNVAEHSAIYQGFAVEYVGKWFLVEELLLIP